ncbi:uncharacterized protein LOC116951921 isoform X2 [Petromyzon marinus]|uniref:Uncharacterized protein LOC116951921 isoform X2 n=2 Tax=Petromyzon marinus TaxID=7757 RepID=A0AAJ7U110_PETMA|nr:uncharacterized protein LOC116951921 isoform X2 [Petromyzon marinus]
MSRFPWMGERAAVGVNVSAGMSVGPGGARPPRWGQWDPPSPRQRDRIERLRTEMATVRAMDVDLFHRFTQLLAEVRSLRLHLNHECASSSSSSSSSSKSSTSRNSIISSSSSTSVGEPCASTPHDSAEPPELMTPPPRPPTPPHHRHRLLLHRCRDRPRCLHLPNSPPHSRETQPKATVDSQHDEVAQDDVGGDGGGERPGDRGLTLGSAGSSDSDDSTLRFRGPLPRLRICETPAEASSAEEEDEEAGGEETMGRGSSAPLPRLPVVPGAPGAHERHGGHGGDEGGVRVVVGSAELHGEGSRGEHGGGRAPRFGDRWRWPGEGTDASFV